MNFYQDLGYLVLGSRLRRVSEAFLSEINKTYRLLRIEFDASWFPVFYLLSEKGSLSIKELSHQIEISHPAASQLVTNLKQKGLLQTSTCKDDGRRQMVELSEKGKQLLAQVLPVWDAIKSSMEDLAAADAECEHLLAAIAALESSFRSVRLSEKVSHKLSLVTQISGHE